MSSLRNIRVSATLAVSALALASTPAFAQESIDAPDFGHDPMLFVALPSQTANFQDQIDSAQIPQVNVVDGDRGPLLAEHSGSRWGKGGGKGAGCHMGGGCGPMGCLTGENALTDDQYEKIYELRNEMLDTLGPKMAEYSSAKRHLVDALTQETVDTKKAESLQKQISSLKAEITSLKLANKTAMAQVLTGDQRKAIRQAMIKGSGKRKMMMMHMRRGR